MASEASYTQYVVVMTTVRNDELRRSDEFQQKREAFYRAEKRYKIYRQQERSMQNAKTTLVVRCSD